MKSFISTYVICFICCVLFMFFGGSLIITSTWLFMAFCALIMALIVTGFSIHGEKIEKLEKRVEELEKNKEE